MKKMHVQSRLLSLLLVLALLWGFAAPASAAGAAHRDGVSFTQVDNSAVSASLLEQEAEEKAGTGPRQYGPGACFHCFEKEVHPGSGLPGRAHGGATLPP